MLYPTLNEVTELLNEYKVTPVFCEVLSDTMRWKAKKKTVLC